MPQQVIFFFCPDDWAGIGEAGLNATWPVKVFIHGFSDTALTSWTRVGAEKRIISIQKQQSITR
jgi:hypothetical protein